jgi:hypothetical protein
VIVLCARQGASLRRRRGGAGAIRSLFQLIVGTLAIGIGEAGGCLWVAGGSRFDKCAGRESPRHLDECCNHDRFIPSNNEKRRCGDQDYHDDARAKT